jgi:RNA polymerase sigma factor (sigma-70 family)
MKRLETGIDTLFTENRRNLINMLFPIVDCYQTSEDLSQEAYLKVTDAIRQYPIKSPRAFLFQTAKNLALDHLRKEKVRSLHIDHNADESAILEIALSAPSPEKVVFMGQQMALLLKVLADQPQQRREMLILHKAYGWHYPEIADYFGLSVSSIEKKYPHCLSPLPGRR